MFAHKLRRESTRSLRALSTLALSTRRGTSHRLGAHKWAAFKPRVQVRHVSATEQFRNAYRHSPVLLSLGISSAIAAAGFLLYTNYLYYKQLHKFASYPEKVGLKLRRALYFTDIKFEPAHAARAFQQALKLAEEEGMNPFSDEVIGIKIEMARFLEVSHNYEGSIQFLEAVKDDCLRWIEVFGALEGNAGDRTRLLAVSVQMSVKIAELCSLDYVADRDKAEQLLVWAVETSVKERLRREKEGLKRGEGPWLDDDQMGAEFERLATMYGDQDNNYLAFQLYLQALALKTERDCHTATLMQNVGMAMGLQRPPPQPNTPPALPEQLRESGRAWINKAVELARNIEPPVRNSECDEVCIAAAINLAHFFLMDNNVDAARDKFQEAGSLANAIGNEEGIIAANEGLRDLSGQTPQKKWW